MTVILGIGIQKKDSYHKENIKGFQGGEQHETTADQSVIAPAPCMAPFIFGGSLASGTRLSGAVATSVPKMGKGLTDDTGFKTVAFCIWS